MSDQRVGSCSLCGGDVMGHRGTWMAVGPPPPDRCSSCGAVRGDDVIPMRRPRNPHPPDDAMMREFFARLSR